MGTYHSGRQKARLFCSSQDASAVTQDDVVIYLNHLYNDLGIRHLFPIHLTNNVFGGPALYNDLFNLDNFFLHGTYFQVEDGSPLGFQFPTGCATRLHN